MTSLYRQLQVPYRVTRTAVFYLTVLPQLVACGFREPPSTVRAHSLVFQRMDGGRAELATATLPAAPAGNVTVVSVGRGDLAAFRPPTSDAGDLSFAQLGPIRSYTNWPNSGTGLYAAVDPVGGRSRAIRVSTPPNDEVTAAVVVVEGQRVEDMAWNEVLVGNPLTSLKVTTTGPATLVAFWWGDAGVRYDKHAVPNNGFQVVDSVLKSGALVQCAVAVKRVTAAGSYDVTWRAWPFQGAQLWLVAIQ